MELKRDNIKCDCGYENHIDKLYKYGGKCLKCKKILDKRVYFNRIMLIKTHNVKELKKRGLNY